MPSRPVKDVSASKWTCMCGCGGKVAPGASFVHGHNLAFKHSSPWVQSQVQEGMKQRRASKGQEVPPALPDAVKEAAEGQLSRPAGTTPVKPAVARTPRDKAAEASATNLGRVAAAPKPPTIKFTQTDPKPSPAKVAASQVDMPVPKPRARRKVPDVDAQLAGRADAIPAAAVPAIADIKTVPDSRHLPAAQEAAAMREAASKVAQRPTRGKGTRRAADLSAEEVAAICESKDSFRALGERYNITKDVVATVRRKAAEARRGGTDG